MTTLFGIRHHGPGCARSLLAALEALSPDVVVLEMPQDAEAMLIHAADADMKPPVALLMHEVERPERASFYPFAAFSPEWQAVRWALAKGVPVRCFDLPAAHAFALRQTAEPMAPRPDAFEWFARADGYSDGERWWNDRVEERSNDQDFFAAILEAVTALRSELAEPESRESLLREAWMRKTLRAVEKEGFTTIAVVCGAWHTPALSMKVKSSDDAALLKGLPKEKVAATWIPWTFERLTFASGYGAGITSPGWYDHLWSCRGDAMTTWLTRAARLFRKEGQDASSASVIEAVRLSNALAGLRGRPQPGLNESLEAIQSVFCQGDPLPLQFLNSKLLIGERMGELPEGLPKMPLQQDIESTQRRLRLKPAASVTPVDLDLREEGGRARSVFLHRLTALAVTWGHKERARTRGTFKERWVLQWKPELAVSIIDASAFGNTVETAAARRLVTLATTAPGLGGITEKLDLSLLGELPEATAALLLQLEAAAATSVDLTDLLASVPTLARIARYGDVRATDVESVTDLIRAFASRVNAGLLVAASGIDDMAAEHLSKAVSDHASAMILIDDRELAAEFHAVLGRMAEASSVHPKVQGRAVRLLRDAGALGDDLTARHLGFALSPGMPARAGADWLEGFLQGGGSLLVHDRLLLGLVDDWLKSLSPDGFQLVLPLLRRTFGGFSVPERTRIAANVASGTQAVATRQPMNLDLPRALPAVAAVARLLGLPEPS